MNIGRFDEGVTSFSKAGPNDLKNIWVTSRKLKASAHRLDTVMKTAVAKQQVLISNRFGGRQGTTWVAPLPGITGPSGGVMAVHVTSQVMNAFRFLNADPVVVQTINALASGTIVGTAVVHPTLSDLHFVSFLLGSGRTAHLYFTSRPATVSHSDSGAGSLHVRWLLAP